MNSSENSRSARRSGFFFVIVLIEHVRAFSRYPGCPSAGGGALRRVALGRKNYLFDGDVAAGQSLAGLYSLVATCESRGINPFDYLTDVLARVQDHPANALDALLPAGWAAAN